MVILGPGYGLVIGDRKFFLFSPEISRFNNGYYRTRFFKEEEKKMVNAWKMENSIGRLIWIFPKKPYIYEKKSVGRKHSNTNLGARGSIKKESIV